MICFFLVCFPISFLVFFFASILNFRSYFVMLCVIGHADFFQVFNFTFYFSIFGGDGKEGGTCGALVALVRVHLSKTLKGKFAELMVCRAESLLCHCLIEKLLSPLLLPHKALNSSLQEDWCPQGGRRSDALLMYHFYFFK